MGLMQRVILLMVLCVCGMGSARPLGESLTMSGDNRVQIETAMAKAPVDQHTAMTWLIEHMPAEDLKSLDAAYLLENVDLAYRAWKESPWHDQVPEQVFLEAILPHASVNERRDAWRKPFNELCAPFVVNADSPAAAAAMLNNVVFPKVGVKYSTKRPKADQSPFESMDAGMASCTGLSVLLVDACRSVGVPARFVGTPLWTDGSGNHSWVEIWHDGDWHFTGAAEPTGDALNKAWFTSQASGAIEGDPEHAIFAATWRDVPSHFPMSWRPDDMTVGGIDVTHRYVGGDLAVPDGSARLRIRVIDEEGARRSLPVRVMNDAGETFFEGMSRDERFDTNDHLHGVVPRDEAMHIVCDGTVQGVSVAEDQRLVTLRVPRDQALSKSRADEIRERAVTTWANRERDAAETALAAGEVTRDGTSMKFTWRVHGERPQTGRSMYISLHGGGGTTSDVNDSQWANQGKMYGDLKEGVYVAPRAPSDTWNLWHRDHIDGLLDELIETMVLTKDVDPDRVYLMGYSAGGDGVYQLAPRMADRFAAASAMAGHPNETVPDGLRNVPFTIHMGGDDGAYRRNDVARQWKKKLARAQLHDPGGFTHHVEIHEGMGHWMKGRDAAAIDWMSEHVRRDRPERIVWKQDDVVGDRYYWLKVDDPVQGDRKVIEVGGQAITIVEPGAPGTLRIRLDDELVDMNRPVRVQTVEGIQLFGDIVPRQRRMIEQTLAERGDPRGVYLGEIVIELPVRE